MNTFFLRIVAAIVIAGAYMTSTPARAMDPATIKVAMMGVQMVGKMMSGHQHPQQVQYQPQYRGCDPRYERCGRNWRHSRFGNHSLYPRPQANGRVYYNDGGYVVNGRGARSASYSSYSRFKRKTTRSYVREYDDGRPVATAPATAYDEGRARDQLARDVQAAFGPVPAGVNYNFAMTPKADVAPRPDCKRARTAQSPDGAYTLARWICPRSAAY